MVFKIRIAQRGDARVVAKMHMMYLPEGFLSSIGEMFLEGLYDALILDESSIVFVAVDGDKIIGFVAGSIDFKRTYFKVICRKFLLFLRVGLINTFKEGFLRKVFETFIYSRNSGGSMPNAELLSIAINECFRGRGVGKSLFDELVEWFKGNGVVNFKIVVGKKLSFARDFYLRQGCREVSNIILHNGEKSVIYFYDVR